MVNETGISEVTQELPQVGSDLGGFLSYIGPGLAIFVTNFIIIGLILTIFATVGYITYFILKMPAKKN